MYVIKSEETFQETKMLKYTPKSQSMRHIVSLEMGYMIVMYKFKVSHLFSAGVGREGKGKGLLQKINF